MKIDCTKTSNKGDVVALIGTVVVFVLFGFVLYLSATNNTFIAGFTAATVTWKWKDWVFKPIDQFLERHWPSN